ncbi:hypothetical protein SCA6_008296 [Theobroma cacao]
MVTRLCWPYKSLTYKNIPSPRCRVEPRKECSVLEMAVGTCLCGAGLVDFENIKTIETLSLDECSIATLRPREQICFTFD